jgi:hypothetical protein
MIVASSKPSGASIMFTVRSYGPWAIAGLLAWSSTGTLFAAPPVAVPNNRNEVLLRQGNFKEAYEGFRKSVLDPQGNPLEVSHDLQQAIFCLARLNRIDEIDDFREAAVELHKGNWRLLQAAAESYLGEPHFGFVVAGTFQRGSHRGGGRLVHATERDRVRALQLFAQAMPRAYRDEAHADVAQLYLAMSRALLNGRGYVEAWRLQYLTDLKTLPDYEEGWMGYRQTGGAPVDEQGNPVFHHVPKDFAAAGTDGERWRWCLVQAVEFDPHLHDAVELDRADFLLQQFGVQTMAQYGHYFGRMESDDARHDTSGTYALHTLGEDETIARLATGVKRFKLPDEFNFIKIYQSLAAAPGANQVAAGEHLAQIFENRRQYPRAADYWRLCSKHDSRETYRLKLQQIEGNWGQFEAAHTQPAGKGANVDFRFRNGKSVSFTAHEIDVPRLLDDLKAYLKSNPRQLDWRKMNIGNLGYRMVDENSAKYVGIQVAQWTLPLEPREQHFDKRITVATPLQKPGAYLLTANMAAGNISKIILWVDDTAIVKKPMPGKTFYFVADAVTGKPVAKANVEFFGYRQDYRNNVVELQTKQFAEFTDADGQVIVDGAEESQQYQWLITARDPGGRFAYLGFTGMWRAEYYDAQYNEVKLYTITDRPVYRPGQKVHYKFWIGHAQYDQADRNEFAGQTFAVEVQNPKGDKILQRQLKADDFGGLEGDLDLPADAMLGVYSLAVLNRGGSQFRVEEYKKPEYEVTVDAPAEPVLLGDKIQATIKAKYYFGAPVTRAKVKYKIERSGYTERWYPMGAWDWLYGPGYWWFAYDYDWYPGWQHWGCRRPIFSWWPQTSFQPPELVAEREVEIGADGMVKVDIDTTLAKAIHPDEDHQYNISVEVVDPSRRTILGSGRVLVARKPFTVTAWVNRGHYRVGDVVHANFAARTLDGKPVAGKGTAQLLQVSYVQGSPQETAVQTWDLPTDEQGTAHLQIKASAVGQYRLSYKLTDAKGHAIEAGYLFTIAGDGFDGAQFRFQNLELIPDKREYQPEEKVRLQVNTDRVGGTVLLFVRPANGVYLAPEVIRLDGKSTMREIAVTRKDMPNFFIEAVTVADGHVYQETREIIVPPEKRLLNVAVTASADSYRPGQKAAVKIRLTDFHDAPFVGTTVVAVYDKSLEYISGGSNVPDIKEFFWKWRRQHMPHSESSLDRFFYSFGLPKMPVMQNLGIFGGSVADEGRAMQFKGGGVTHSRGLGSAPGGARRAMFVESDGMSLGGAVPPPMAPAAAAMAGNAGVTVYAGGTLALNGSASGKGDAGGAAAALVQPALRSKFADTALWVAALTTDKDGMAKVELDMPENLTTWRIKTWAMGLGTQVGEGFVDVMTRKDLLVRLQAPRFFVEKDEVVLSANVHNYLKRAKSVQVLLEIDGKQLRPLDAVARTVPVPANDEVRVDWRVKVVEEGEVAIRMKALSDEESDAIQQKFPCYVHGMLKMESYCGVIRPERDSGRISLAVPAERRAEQSRLEVRWSPTLAGAMVDALPYLVDYPYGCTEQTLSRFLPTVMVQKILIDKGLDLEAIRKKHTNLNAQEIGDDRQRAERWKQAKRNPVFDTEEVRRMAKAGLEKLTEMQLSDGGWGWFSGWGEYSSPHTTAYVVHGLQIAQHNDLALVPGVIERGVQWLKQYQAVQIRLLELAAKKPAHERWKEFADDLDAFVYMVLADAGASNAPMREFLYRDRTHLAVYSMAMFGLALEKEKEADKLAMLLRNLRQYLVEDEENQTAWLRLPENNYWWCWYGSEYEAQAYYLKLLARTDPRGSTTSRLVKYLLNNRHHATYWNSTRDTALCIEALADYLRASGEDKPEMTVEVWLDGQLKKAVEITPANLFDFDNKLVVEGAALAAGPHQVELKRKGQGPLYYNGYLTNFTLEETIAKAGLEVKVQRKYYLLHEQQAAVQTAGSRGQAVNQNVQKYRREELANLALLKSGQLVEIELEIDSKNDYEYLVFEDLKPAGFEPVELRSGYSGNEMGAYVEFRDNRVVFFVSQLARGKHSVSYRMRAEIPGRFSALPARGWGMYAPELKGNSDEIKLRVED